MKTKTKNLKHYFFAFPLLSFLFSCSTQQKKEKTDQSISTRINHPELKAIYDSAKVSGCFVLLDEKKQQWHIFDSTKINFEVNAASTFKIPNSLIGLECGSVKDENEVMKWDGVKRQNEKWNADTDMKNALKNSTVWFYQELARRTGPVKMKEYLDKMHYGNADTSGGITAFWLKGGLKISPNEQIDFLKRLYHDSLPYSQRSMSIVKKILVREEGKNYKLSAKTGWASGTTTDLGWYVGYLEKDGEVFYFANQIISTDLSNENFAASREGTCRQILCKLGLLCPDQKISY